MTSWNNQTKNTSAYSLSERTGVDTWDDAHVAWDDANNDWVAQFTTFSNQSKHASTFTNISKS